MKPGYTTLDFLCDCETLINECGEALDKKEYDFLEGAHADVEHAGRFTLTDNQWARFRRICERFEDNDMQFLQ